MSHENELSDGTNLLRNNMISQNSSKPFFCTLFFVIQVHKRSDVMVEEKSIKLASSLPPFSVKLLLGTWGRLDKIFKTCPPFRQD